MYMYDTPSKYMYKQATIVRQLNAIQMALRWLPDAGPRLYLARLFEPRHVIYNNVAFS